MVPAVVIFAAVTMTLNRQHSSPRAIPSRPAQASVLEVVESESPSAAQPIEPSVKSERCVTALLEFINAPDHRTRCEFVFGRIAMRDILEKHYAEVGHCIPRRVINPDVSAVAMQDREIIIVSFSDENGKVNAAPFEWDGDSYRLHWEAFAGYGEISWQQFFDSRPDGEYEMRVKLFIPENSEIQKGAITALLSHPDLPSPKFVTIPAGSNTYRQLANCKAATDVPALIGIRWPKDRALARPVISRWIHRDWIGF